MLSFEEGLALGITPVLFLPDTDHKSFSTLVGLGYAYFGIEHNKRCESTVFGYRINPPSFLKACWYSLAARA